MGHQQEQAFLRQQRSAIQSYVKNYTLTPQETREYKKLAKKLAELVAIKTHLDILAAEKQMLSFNMQLMSMVGQDNQSYKEKWSKKHAQFMKETNRYEQKKKSYLG